MYKVIMLISVSFVPLVLIVTAALFKKYPIKEPNIAIGFRTKMSMMNKDTWNYAQRLFPLCWMKLGRILLPISIAALFLLYSEDNDYTGRVVTVLMFIQALLMLASAAYVNLKLNKVFNKDGTRKEVQ